MSSKKRYDQMVSEGSGDGHSTHLRDLAALVELRLGKPLDKPTFMKLAQIQTEARKHQEKLAASLEDNDIGPEVYLSAVNDVLRVSMRRSRELLGSNRFIALFGEAGLNPEGLIDRETFLESRGRRAPVLSDHR